MDKKHAQPGGSEMMEDAPLIADRPAFAADEMVACDKCGRSNPPNRTSCFYCAAGLETAPLETGSARAVLRKLEGWEKGYNVIYHPGGEPPDRATTAEIAKTVGLEPGVLEDLFRAANPLPIARVEGESEAGMVEDILRGKGIDTSIVTDRALAGDIYPKRLRTLIFDGEELLLTLFNTGETDRVKRSDLAVIVVGAMFEKRTETIEKRKKGASKTLDEYELSSDDVLVDIYTAADPTGWRIPASGFDFSGLGNEKGLLAARNMLTLIARLREFAPGAKVADAYIADRGLLGAIWEEEQRKDFTGLKRSGFGKADFGKIASTNNLGQFTKYSRLQWQLL